MLFFFLMQLSTLNCPCQASYPAAIIILVSTFMSHSDIVNGTYTNGQEAAQLCNPQHHLNTIQITTGGDIVRNLYFAPPSINSLLDSRGGASIDITEERVGYIGLRGEDGDESFQDGPLKAIHSVV